MWANLFSFKAYRMDWTNVVSPILTRNSKINLTMIWSNWMKCLKSENLNFNSVSVRMFLDRRYTICTHFVFDWVSHYFFFFYASIWRVGVSAYILFWCYMVWIRFKKNEHNIFLRLCMEFLYTIRWDITFFWENLLHMAYGCRLFTCSG